MRRVGSIGRGAVIAVLLGLAQLAAADEMPAGPAQFRSQDLGISFSGPEKWFVGCHGGKDESGTAWQFSPRYGVITNNIREIYDIYTMIYFSTEQFPTPKVPQVCAAYYVKLPPHHSFEDFMKARQEIDEASLEHYKLLAGPVKDKIAGRKAVTLAYSTTSDVGQFDYNSHIAEMRTQLTAVPVKGGVLLLTAFSAAKDWEALRPHLRAWRHSVKIKDPPED